MNAPTPPGPRLRAALAAAREDRIVYDLAGIAGQLDELRRELPGAVVRFAMKSCPVDEVLACLAARGCGFDAASPEEVRQALATGVPASRVHYGSTVKSDRDIAAAFRLGVRDFATDSLADVRAVAAQAPGARVFCRLATDGRGALWGLGGKFGCSVADAVAVLAAARDLGLVPAGLSLHVGSQQMDPEAWRRAVDLLAEGLERLARRGIRPDHVNLGGGLPASGCLDRDGRPLEPPLDKIFATVREGTAALRAEFGEPLGVVLEPGRHLVAAHGAIRAHVVRLTERRQPHGAPERWLYLSCGKFNGLYEMDQLQYPLHFPDHLGAERVPAVVAGPTCDSDDAYGGGRGLAQVPRSAASGDPVWVLGCGAYATSYTTRGFNGFRPLPHQCLPIGSGAGRPG